MRGTVWLIGVAVVLGVSGAPRAQSPAPPAADAVRALVSRLELERYKATIKGLTQFGDRRQGTERNRKAVDWIEAQLTSYGCSTERIKYEFNPPAPNPTAANAGARPAPNPDARGSVAGVRVAPAPAPV